MTGCSKAPWGLSVLRRGMRIFTHATISPSLSLRQRPSRYAIRAGRNLPDKEFRYLRTVIVTAAIHQGFDSRLPPARNAEEEWRSAGEEERGFLLCSFSPFLLCFF